MAEEYGLALGYHAHLLGGLGFNYKWNMGWMNDMLRYMQEDPTANTTTSSLFPSCTPLAKTLCSLYPMMKWSMASVRFWTMRETIGKVRQSEAFLGYLMGHPGKKLLFMGYGGQFISDMTNLDWHLLEYPMHRQMWEYNKALNLLQENQSVGVGPKLVWLSWIDANDSEQSVLYFKKRQRSRRLSGGGHKLHTCGQGTLPDWCS